jgi:predicted acylesterase/phospholipase RssA
MDRFMQTRYAVVLNGGVSLAIWMGGVTHELNRIRLASEAVLNPDGSRRVSPAWLAILRACNRTAIIDILAGTSAGGLNGTLLATAVARGGDMPDMAELWSTVASINVGALTRKDSTAATSVLDGEYFSRQVDDILAQIRANEGITPRECTLLVTATALDSEPLPTMLETGNSMYARDGRRVYKFERKEAPDDPGTEVTNDFAPAAPGLAALCRAARASASYPVAFEPVWETEALRLRRQSGSSRCSARWLVDGGVLDNAPFEPLISALRERPNNEPSERVLLYVTPGTAAGVTAPPPVTAPSLKETLNQVLSAIREPDERIDADALGTIFRQMSLTRSQVHRTILDYLAAPADDTIAPLLFAAGHLFPRYRRTRAEAIERWLGLLSGEPDAEVLAPPHPPLLAPEAVPGIPTGEFPALEGLTWRWGWSTADRILRWWGRALSQLNVASPEFSAAMSAVGAAQSEVSARWADLESAVTGDAADPKTTAEQIAAMIHVYGLGPDGLGAVLTAAMDSAASAIVRAIPEVDRQTLLQVSLAAEVVTGSLSWLGEQYDTPTFRFHNVTPAVATPPGIDLGSVGEQADWPARKLYGERLGHFGAFVSPDGRRHDWLWGRLDGASELSNQLLSAACVAEDAASALRAALIAEVLASVGKSPQQIAAEAATVYDTTAGDMVADMARIDHGQSFRKLEATVWELSPQFGEPAIWLRAVLAPKWSKPDARFGKQVVLHSARVMTAPIRWILRSKLPYR